MKMNQKLACVLVFAALSLASLSFAGDTPDGEIHHLLDYLKGSGCEFYRNGSWHGADEAVVHLTNKYQYLDRRGLVDTAEQFIERAATKSSMSGNPYQVKCGDSEPLPSAEWFEVELQRYRENR